MKAALVGLAALGLAGCGHAPAGPLDGTFGNVYLSPETLDAGGYQIELRLSAPEPQVVLAICEGGCYGGVAQSVTVDGETIRFSVPQHFVSSDGRPVEEPPLRFTARVSRKAVWLSSLDWPDVKDERLKWLTKAEPGDTARMARNFQ